MRAEYERALGEGRAAKIGTRNPYADGVQLAMAALWTRGYNRMLLERFYSKPSMQPSSRHAVCVRHGDDVVDGNRIGDACVLPTFGRVAPLGDVCVRCRRP